MATTPTFSNAPSGESKSTEQRDVQVIEALQTVQRVLNGTDGLKNPWLKLARVKKAVDEALRLMQPEVW